MAAVNEKLLDERLAALEAARGWSPRLVSKLESHIRSADDAALLRINPISFATEKNLAEDEAIDLFLHASALGLFEMNWILICPRLLLRHRQLPGAQESQQPLPLHQLPHRSRGCARRHDRGHLHGEPGRPPDRLSRSGDALGRGLHLSLSDGGGGADPGWHPLHEDKAEAGPRDGLHRTGRDEDARGSWPSRPRCVAAASTATLDSCSSSIPPFRRPSSALRYAVSSIPARRMGAPLRRAR